MSMSRAICNVQGSRDVPSGHTGLAQCVTRVSFPPGLGVSEPWDTSKVTVSQYYAGDGRYTQEPVFVPKAQTSSDPAKPFDAQEGYIMVQVNDMRDSQHNHTVLEILDAEDLEGGPVAVIQGQVSLCILDMHSGHKGTACYRILLLCASVLKDCLLMLSYFTLPRFCRAADAVILFAT